MPLNKLINKKNLVVLGLNSGTSADGLDLAAVKIYRKKSKVAYKYLCGSEVKFSKKLKEQILSLADSKRTTLDEVVYIDNLLGKYMGQTAKRFIDKHSDIKIDLIASHGQTVRHLPSRSKTNSNINGSLQLGSADFIAELTEKVVISDFRQAEIALGGEGAPITTDAVRRLMAAFKKESTVVVNIGGMSNYFYFPKPSRRSIAADCGPGNSMIDLVCGKLFDKKYDRSGKLASKGKLSKRLLTLISGISASKEKTISTGREQYGEVFVNKIISYSKKLKIDKYDVIRTVTEFTADAVTDSLSPILKKDKTITKLYLTGGGRKNIFLLNLLKDKLSLINILSVDDLGLNGDYLEAISYALMGEAAIRSEASEINTGRKDYNTLPVCGKISQPPCRRK